jgi:hypothetical protein
MNELTIGAQLHSSVCTTSVIVVRPGDSEIELRCGGQPMLNAPPATLVGEPDAELANGTLLSKRYVHEPTGLEVMCTKAGRGTLTVNGQPLAVKAPTPLPSSD